MKERLSNEMIVLRATKEVWDGCVCNLGYGMPTMVGLFIPESIKVIFHAENGILGYGHPLSADERDKLDFQLINASGQFVHREAGMSFFDSAACFAMIRGGHVDLTILGGLQVSEKGDLANWRIPGRLGGMGGAMDLAVGAQKVIVVMEHTSKDGEPKILKECTYPLTGKGCVDTIITDVAVIEVTKEGLVLKELAPSWTVEEVQALTEPKLIIHRELKEMEL
jgi:3-oxoacid CoA-transferase B subunit